MEDQFLVALSVEVDEGVPVANVLFDDVLQGCCLTGAANPGQVCLHGALVHCPDDWLAVILVSEQDVTGLVRFLHRMTVLLAGHKEARPGPLLRHKSWKVEVVFDERDDIKERQSDEREHGRDLCDMQVEASSGAPNEGYSHDHTEPKEDGHGFVMFLIGRLISALSAFHMPRFSEQ